MVKLIYLLTSYNFVSADLSLEYIEEKVNATFKGKNAVYKQTIANPFFGFLADKLGMVHNLRFYSPYLDVTDKGIINEHIEFKKDESKDPLTSLNIKLFPSPAGELSPSTTHSENPLSLFRIDQEDSVKFFAKLFVTLLNDEKNFDYRLAKPKDIKANIFEKKEKVFEEIKSKILAEPKGNYFKDKDIRLLLIHAYIITALDPANSERNKSENQNEDLFEVYLTEILNGIKSIGANNLLIIDETILKNAIDKYNALNFFPYSQLNQPLPNSLVPAYNRESRIFDYTNMFSDCAEVSLLHICNCLFFLDGKYSLDHIPEASAELKNFYLKNQHMFTLTEKIRNEWSKVVQDLNPKKSEVQNLESQYPRDIIQYNKAEGTNEIETGIVNMMNILITITGLKRDEFLNDISLKTISKKLEKLIERLSVRDDGKIVAKCNFVEQKCYESNFQTGKKDFFGNFRLSFTYKNGAKAEMEVKHSKFHASAYFISSSFGSEVKELKKDDKIFEQIKNKDIVSEMLKSFLLEEFIVATARKSDFYRKYSIKANSELNNLTNENLFFNNFFLHGKINNNDIKKRDLFYLCIFIDFKNEKGEESLFEEKMLKLITRNLPLSDLGTYEEFKEFICLRPEYLSNYIHDCYDYFDCSKFLNRKYLNSKWNEIFSKEIQKIESLIISNSSFDKKKFKFFCDKVQFFSNLSFLRIETRKLTAKKFKIIVNELIKFQKIKELEIESPNCDFELPENFKELKSLKNLILKDLNLKKQFETIGKLDKLQTLSLELCDFDENRLDTVLSYLVNLEYLKIIDPTDNFTKLPNSIQLSAKLKDLEIRSKQFSTISNIKKTNYKII